MKNTNNFIFNKAAKFQVKHNKNIKKIKNRIKSLTIKNT